MGITYFVPLRLTAARFIVAKLQDRAGCPSTEEWIKKLGYVDTVEFLSTIKKNGMMSLAGKLMKLKIITLSKLN